MAADTTNDTAETAVTPSADAVTTDPTDTTDEAQEGSGGGGWFAASKRDMDLITSRHPEHWFTIWGVWSVLIREANRVHCHSFRMTRGQLARRCCVSPRTIARRINELKSLKLLKTYTQTNKETGLQETTKFTIRPSVSVCQNLHSVPPQAHSEQCANLSALKKAHHITRTPSSKGGSCIKKKREGKDVFSGLPANAAPKTSAPSSGEKKSTATDIGTAIDFGRWV